MFSSQNHNFNAKTHTTTAYEPHYEVGKDFLNTHKTLLFKLAWTVLTKKDCNCARILNSKYLRGKHFLALQQKWTMVTKSSEDKQFRHQMITFSEEKKNLSPNIIKNLKLVTKSIFRNQRCTNWWWNQYFVTKDVQIGNKIFISSL